MAKIRLFHTSDWHLGKRLFQKERSDEHKIFLDWLINEIQKKQIDYLIIAGDIFDVPSPPNTALKLFFDFIYRLGKLPNLKTIIIGGNHDSSSLLKIPEHFFSDINCKIFTGLCEDLREHNIIDEIRGTKIGFKTLPYFKNYELINHLTNPSMLDESTHDKSIKEFFLAFFQQWDENPDFKFLISHHSFGHSEMAGSEQAIYLSGVESFPTEWIKESFDYAALGHIHKKTELSHEPPIIYPGSPIPLRFSESNKKKMVELVIDSELNKLSYEYITIPNHRELIQIKGDQKKVLDKIKHLVKPQEDKLIPFVEIILELDSPQSGLSQTLKEELKDKGYELISYIPVFQNTVERKNINQKEISGLSLEDVFKKYYAFKFEDKDVPQKILENFKEIMQDIQSEDS